MGFQETFESQVIPAGNRAFGVSVTLAQGELVTETFTAVWEDSEYEITDVEGHIGKFNSRDFMFAKSDVVFDTETLRPRSGDRISMIEADGQTKEYEIAPIAALQAVEEMDGGYRWKAHTKRVG